MAEVKTKPAAKKAATTAKKSSSGESPETGALRAEAGTAKKPAARKKASTIAMAAPGAEERYKMTELAAYYIAQRNGFAGDPKAYWAEAEEQISQMLSKKPR